MPKPCPKWTGTTNLLRQIFLPTWTLCPASFPKPASLPCPLPPPHGPLRPTCPLLKKSYPESDGALQGLQPVLPECVRPSELLCPSSLPAPTCHHNIAGKQAYVAMWSPTAPCLALASEASIFLRRQECGWVLTDLVCGIVAWLESGAITGHIPFPTSLHNPRCAISFASFPSADRLCAKNSTIPPLPQTSFVLKPS